MTIFQGSHPYANDYGCGPNGNTMGGGMDFNFINSLTMNVDERNGDGRGDGTISFHIELNHHITLHWYQWN